MEKRATQRHLLDTSIVCSFLNSVNFGQPVDGRMKNCCVHGLYAEVRFHFKTGTVIAIPIKGKEKTP